MANIDQYLKFMLKAGASDFHLSTGSAPIYRIDGSMRPVAMSSSEPMTTVLVWELLKEILPERNRNEFEKIQDTDFAYDISGIGRFRVNVFKDRKGVGAVFRYIPEKILSLEQLGLPQTLNQFCMLNAGLVLVTGPTGSGKSTTLAAMVDYINLNRNDHLVTIEDPIEFVHQNKSCLINQREVNSHTESFKNALRAALRQDPDIVLVGEMRDLETTEIAIETAETGPLVLGTLHTNTAASTVNRIIDQFPATRQAQIRTMLSASLQGVISQTLLKRANGKGRIAALEILVVTPAVANNIREGKTHQIPSTIQTGGQFGMQLLGSHMIKLVRAKIVDPQEAYRKAVDKADMAAKLRAAGFQLDIPGSVPQNYT